MLRSQVLLKSAVAVAARQRQQRSSQCLLRQFAAAASSSSSGRSNNNNNNNNNRGGKRSGGRNIQQADVRKSQSLTNAPPPPHVASANASSVKSASSQQSASRRTKKTHGAVRQFENLTPTQQLAREVVGLRNRFMNLPPLPPVWTNLDDGSPTAPTSTRLDDQEMNDAEGYKEVWQDTRALVDKIDGMMRENRNAVRSRELAIFLGEILVILSTSSYDDCRRILGMIQQYNLDLPHYDHAIQAAALERNWSEAARLFREKIDPDDSGYTPVDMSVQNPLGLYAIAKDAQNNGHSNVADRVMDAVMSLTMVSPTDQERCEYYQQECSDQIDSTTACSICSIDRQPGRQMYSVAHESLGFFSLSPPRLPLFSFPSSHVCRRQYRSYCQCRCSRSNRRTCCGKRTRQGW